MPDFAGFFRARDLDGQRLMSSHAAIDLDFADGTYRFRLGLGEIAELEEKAKRGIFLIHDDLDPKVRSAKSSVISETLRIGLIGGGTKPADALALVRRYVDQRPLTESLFLAYAVVVAALTRVSGVDLPKSSGAEEAGPGELEAAKDEQTSPPSILPVS